MVVFGMVLMAIFGLGSVFMLVNDPGKAMDPSAREVFVKWNGGQLNKGQVQNLRLRHYASGRFIAALASEASKARGGRFPSVAIPIQWMPENMPVRDVDSNMAQRYILAERAKQAGIVISDSMVSDYISLVHNLVDFSLADLQQINRNANGEYSDLIDIRSHLKMELAAQQYTILLNTGMPRWLRQGVPTSISPTEAAEYNNRMEKTIECTVLGLNVDDYMSEVKGQPSNSELKKIFAEGRYQLEDPTGTEPGFKRPQRVKIEYVAANYDDFLAAEKLKISDKQVQEEYAKLVKEEDSLVMELVPTVEPENPNGGEAPTPDDDDDAPVPGEDDDAAPAPDDDDSTEENAGNDGDSTEKQKEESTEKSDGQANDEKKKDGDDDLSQLTSPSTHFVSVVQEDENKEQENSEAKQDETAKTGSDANQADENKTDAEQTDPAKQEGGDKQSDDPKMLDEQDDNGEQTGDLLPGEGGQDQEQTPILTRPKELDEALSDLIRERIVSETAFREMRRAIGDAEEKVREQQFDYAEWDSQTDEEKRNTKPPITLNLKELADSLRLQYGETELLDYSEMVENEGFGARQAIQEIPSPFGGPPRRTTRNLADIVFTSLDGRKPYDPGSPVVEFLKQTTILWWPVEIRQTEVQEFDEAKDEVIEFWKRERARELALAAAKAIAEELNSGSKKLKEYSTSAENTGNFTWYLNGLVEPKGVDSPGVEFMDAAFDLSLNECGAALNDLRDHAYVIQKIFEDTRGDAEISATMLENWAKFQRVPPGVSRTADRDFDILRSEIQRSIAKEMNIQWVAE